MPTVGYRQNHSLRRRTRAARNAARHRKPIEHTFSYAFISMRASAFVRQKIFGQSGRDA
ncbi:MULTISPECIES: hypothetical protein [Burkholderia]|uniref:Uncharacterized protein n=1 Tax=Burkholderia humptydooensis MSMB43 TaxID=441157 RepID=A0ABN0G8W2_9BURK|nr:MULTISPECIES: hypothetical protein [Burkholderia]EIP88538.1 hypothetical protein A33K_14636 [Burkholderia humptydooensis MSMB43]